MKWLALVAALCALLTAAYGSLVVFPRYEATNSSWMSMGGRSDSDPKGRDQRRRVEEDRYELRSRCQGYVVVGGLLAGVGLVLGGLALRSSPKWIGGTALASAVPSAGLVLYMVSAGVF